MKRHHEYNGRNVTDGFAGIDIGHDYTQEELEFLKAVDAYKRTQNRPFPTWCEILAVAKSLGYRKTDDDGRTD